MTIKILCKHFVVVTFSFIKAWKRLRCEENLSDQHDSSPSNTCQVDNFGFLRWYWHQTFTLLLELRQT